MIDGVGIGVAGLEGNHRTVGAARYLALVGLVLLEAVSHDGLALAGREHVGAQSNDATTGYHELDVHPVAL